MIYLDSAATSFQKPISVQTAVLDAIQNMSSVGRGNYPSAMRAANLCYDCRVLVGELFDCDAEQVVFTSNATHGLNIAINSLVKRGDRVVVSGFEHNAVTRPLHAIGAKISVAESKLFDDETLLAQLSLLLPRASACVCTHVSNVFGYILPIAEIAKLCEKYAVPLIIDASQSAGALPISLKTTKAKFIAMPAHKGLLGIQGGGLLLCADKSIPIIYGGTGGDSLRQTMPDELPERLEAGTMNIPAIAGLYAGVKYVSGLGLSNISAHETALKNEFVNQLKSTQDLEIFTAENPDRQSAVLSLRTAKLDCESLADILGKYDIATRAGLHCSAFAHHTAGTTNTGTLRFSFSAFNTFGEIMQTAEIFKDILSKT